jgi:hypothetical protein
MIALVQQKFLKTASGGGNPKIMTLGAATTAGNALRLQLCCNTNGGTFTTGVSGGGTWSRLQNTATNALNQSLETWVCENCSAVSSISITQSNTFSILDCVFSEWSGMPSTRADDGNNTTITAASGATVSTPTIMPTGTPILLLASMMSPQTITAGPTNGWTALARVSPAYNDMFAYLVVDPATGASQSTSCTKSASYGQSIAMIAAWDGAASGGGSAASGRRAIPSDSNARRAITA